MRFSWSLLDALLYLQSYHFRYTWFNCTNEYIVLVIFEHVNRTYRNLITWACQRTYLALEHVSTSVWCVNHDVAHQISWQFYCNHCMINLVVFQYRRMKWSLRKACFDALQYLQIAQLSIYLTKHTSERIVLYVIETCRQTYRALDIREHVDKHIVFWAC